MMHIEHIQDVKGILNNNFMNNKAYKGLWISFFALFVIGGISEKKYDTLINIALILNLILLFIIKFNLIKINNNK